MERLKRVANGELEKCRLKFSTYTSRDILLEMKLINLFFLYSEKPIWDE